MNESLVVGWVYPSEVNGLFMQSVLSLILSDDQRGANSRLLRNGGTIGVASGPRIASARNEVVEKFLTKFNSEWLLMVDSDMVFTPEDVDKLFEAANPKTHPIVGGLCFGGGRSGVMFPTIYRLVQSAENQSPIEVIEDYPENALCQVDATGAAFLLMHRSTLLAIGAKYGKPAPWFSEGTIYKGLTFGEDWAFCMRAKDLGIPIYVHTGATIGHVKAQILDQSAYRRYQERKAEIGDGGITQEYRDKFGNGSITPKDVPTYAIIPQKGNFHLTEAVVKQLEREDVHQVLVMDNGSPAGPDVMPPSLVPRIVSMPEASIHRMWNEGIKLAREHAKGPFNLAILNNDIRLGPHAIKRMATALRADDTLLAVCPSYGTKGSGVQRVTGTAGSGGLAGFCFMVKGEAFGTEVPPFDESFEWFYGDDDFVMNVGKSGHAVAIVHGASVEQVNGGSQTHRADRKVVAERDMERFFAKWEGSVRAKEPA
jgi:GT2 family glycosyltransferase